MRTKLLTTAAAAALVLGLAAASAQTMEKGSGGASGGAVEKSAPSSTEAPRSSGAIEKSKTAPTAGQQAQGAGSLKAEGKPEGRAEGKMDSKPDANKAAQSGEGREGSHSGTNKMSSESKSGADKDKMGAQKATDERSGQRTNETAQDRNGAGNKTVGAAPSAETKLTTEQRTQIREKVIATGPRVSHVNFALNVGVAVPRDVRVAEVPSVIIDLHPEWRGYRYFVVNDQIVIVDRETLRIVAILDV
jgi:hypothetical protein